MLFLFFGLISFGLLFIPLRFPHLLFLFCLLWCFQSSADLSTSSKLNFFAWKIKFLNFLLSDMHSFCFCKSDQTVCLSEQILTKQKLTFSFTGIFFTYFPLLSLSLFFLVFEQSVALQGSVVRVIPALLIELFTEDYLVRPNPDCSRNGTHLQCCSQNISEVWGLWEYPWTVVFTHLEVVYHLVPGGRAVQQGVPLVHPVQPQPTGGARETGQPQQRWHPVRNVYQVPPQSGLQVHQQ